MVIGCRSFKSSHPQKFCGIITFQNATRILRPWRAGGKKLFLRPFVRLLG